MLPETDFVCVPIVTDSPLPNNVVDNANVRALFALVAPVDK